MEAAAEELEFERAARLRDDLGALRRAMEKQAVVLGDGTDADVVAFAEDELEAAVQVFHVRGGRVRGQRGWVIDKVEPTETPADWSSSSSPSSTASRPRWPSRRTTPASPVPREVLVPELPPDADALAELAVRAARLPGAHAGAAARRQAGAGRDRGAQRQGGVRPAQAAARRRPHRALGCAAGDPGRARAGQRAAAHRVRRRQPRAGHRRRGVAGGVRGRAGRASPTTGATRSGRAPRAATSRRSPRSPAGGSAATSPSVGRPTAPAVTAARCPPTPRVSSPHQHRDRRALARPGIDPTTGRPRRFAYPPNLFVVDGGAAAGQGGGAVLAELGVTDVAVCGLAKRLEEVWLPAEPGPGDPAAHQRGAVPAAAGAGRGAPVRHHLPPQRRSKRMTASALDGVPGLGAVPEDGAAHATSARCASCGRPASTRSPRCPGSAPATAAAVLAALHGPAGEPDGDTTGGGAHREETRRSPRGGAAADATDAPADARRAAPGSRWPWSAACPGPGRSTAAKVLEDLGWFVVDNLPPELIATMVDLGARGRGEITRIAVVMDVRSRAFTADLRRCSRTSTPAATSRGCCSSRRPTPCWSAGSSRSGAATRCRATAGSSTASPPSARCWRRCATPRT